MLSGHAGPFALISQRSAVPVAWMCSTGLCPTPGRRGRECQSADKRETGLSGIGVCNAILTPPFLSLPSSLSVSQDCLHPVPALLPVAVPGCCPVSWACNHISHWPRCILPGGHMELSMGCSRWGSGHCCWS